MAALVKRRGAHAKLQNEDDVVSANQLVFCIPVRDVIACRGMVLVARLIDAEVIYTRLCAYP